MIEEGLKQTEDLWPEVEEGFGWLKQMAELLANSELLTGEQVQQKFRQLLDPIKQAAQRARQQGQEKLAMALEHLVKVSGSYEPGLFHCYDVMDLEPTNNDLEHEFGRLRHHERRVSGCKKGSKNLVLRGPVRLIAMLVTRLEDITSEELAPDDLQRWRRERAKLHERRKSRAKQRQFRKDPDGYLEKLEQLIDQSTLLS